MLRNRSDAPYSTPPDAETEGASVDASLVLSRLNARCSRAPNAAIGLVGPVLPDDDMLDVESLDWILESSVERREGRLGTRGKTGA